MLHGLTDENAFFFFRFSLVLLLFFYCRRGFVFLPIRTPVLSCDGVLLCRSHRFANVDELISHQFSRALKILKSIMDTTQGKAVLELEAIRLRETTEIEQEDMQYAYDNLLDMLERAVVLHCHNWWVAHYGQAGMAMAANTEARQQSVGSGHQTNTNDSDDEEPTPPPRASRSLKK